MISEELQKQFPHIPKEALQLIVDINFQQLRRSIGKREVLRARKIIIAGFGTFKIGGSVEQKKLFKLKAKINSKSEKKWKAKKRENDLNWLL